ncbi:MAG TPA: hypothetical protein VM597_10190 [Gemmataceae bacterium]|jgi:hypothetical protein|nr:hypothetical protein [Gemmataceae bacterium]
MAELLADRKNNDWAAALLIDADKSLRVHLRASFASLTRRRADVTDKLIHLYTTWGREADAEKRRAERAKYPPEQAPRPRPRG